jgi:tripartite-type tricarboxylate transporter receptor subunit TctC
MIGSTLCSAADNYPDKPIQTIVPFSPGGGADVSQRIFNKYAEPIVGQPLIIVNKPGAGGATGWAELARSRPDGYTLAIITPPYNIIPPLVRPKQTGYTLDQLTYLCIYGVVPDLLYVKEGGQFQTLKDLVDYAKKNPKKIKGANAGTLGADFMAMLLFEKALGVEFTQIPFTGGSESLQATLAGTTEVMVGSLSWAAAQKGKLRPLAIASEERHPLVPDVPTFKELGYDVLSERFRAFGGPANLPKEIVDYWGEVSKKVGSDPKFIEDMNKAGNPAAYRGPVEAKKSVDRMTKDMQEVVDKYDLAK